MNYLCCVADKFITDKRFVVGICHTDIAPVLKLVSNLCKSLRCQLVLRLKLAAVSP